MYELSSGYCTQSRLHWCCSQQLLFIKPYSLIVSVVYWEIWRRSSWNFLNHEDNENKFCSYIGESELRIQQRAECWPRVKHKIFGEMQYALDFVKQGFLWLQNCWSNSHIFSQIFKSWNRAMNDYLPATQRFSRRQWQPSLKRLAHSRLSVGLGIFSLGVWKISSQTNDK